MTDGADAGFDEWLEAVEAGAGTYLACPDGHGSLPPRRVCPDCGETQLTETPLPETGTIETVTVTHIPTPAFADDAPYATAIATFGPIRLTAQVIDVEPERVSIGQTVGPTVTESATTGDPVLAFEPR